jgi:cell division protein ZipA
MHIYLRIAFFITGVCILTGVVWDIWRRRFVPQIGHASKPSPELQPRGTTEALVPDVETLQYPSKFILDDFDDQALLNVNRYMVYNQASLPGQIESIMPPDIKIVKVNTDALTVEPASLSVAAPVAAAPTAAPRELILALSVIARLPRGFLGYQVLRSLESAGLVFGPMQIFHYYEHADQKRALFSVSAVCEPGTFDLAQLPHNFVPGVTLFMQASMQQDNLHAFELLVRTAKQLAFSLNGELHDAEHAPLTMQTIEKYRQMIQHYAHQTVTY